MEDILIEKTENTEKIEFKATIPLSFKPKFLGINKEDIYKIEGFGHVIYGYNEIGKIIYTENKLGIWFKSEYNDKGDLISFISYEGEFFKYSYDEKGNLIILEKYIFDKKLKKFIYTKKIKEQHKVKFPEGMF